jgi:hypothetical protein
MLHRPILLAGALAWAAVVACVGPGSPDALNPDPVHGGACGNGDQLATVCHLHNEAAKTWCCWNEAMCGTAIGECLMSMPPAPPERARDRDAGAAARSSAFAPALGP